MCFYKVPWSEIYIRQIFLHKIHEDVIKTSMNVIVFGTFCLNLFIKCHLNDIVKSQCSTFDLFALKFHLMH